MTMNVSNNNKSNTQHMQHEPQQLNKETMRTENNTHNTI
jgi:hypothetical protein